MPNHTVLPDPNLLRLVCVSAEAGRVTLTATSSLPEARVLCVPSSPGVCIPDILGRSPTFPGKEYP